MACSGIVMLRTLDSEVASNLKSLRTLAPELLGQPEFIAEFWNQYPLFSEAILSAFASKAKTVNEKAKNGMRCLYCRSSMALLEVLFDSMTNVRNIYKGNPSVLKDIDPGLPSVELGYAEVQDFMRNNADSLMAEDVPAELVKQTRMVLAKAKDGEKLLRTYEEFIRNAVQEKRSSKRLFSWQVWLAFGGIVVMAMIFTIPYFIGQAKSWADMHGKRGESGSQVGEGYDDSATSTNRQWRVENVFPNRSWLGF